MNKPPIKCTPCRVRIDGAVYRIKSNGDVFRLHDYGTGELIPEDLPLFHSEARDVRRHAARLRRNRNARERTQAHRDLGLVKTPYGWE